MSGESWIDNERTRLRVHASCEHDIDEVLLLLEMLSIVNNSIVNNLSYKTNWRLGSVLIKVWHIEIIHEIDENLAWWGSESSSCSLVNLRLNDKLECLGVSVGVEIDGSVEVSVLVKG